MGTECMRHFVTICYDFHNIMLKNAGGNLGEINCDFVLPQCRYLPDFYEAFSLHQMQSSLLLFSTARLLVQEGFQTTWSNVSLCL